MTVVLLVCTLLLFSWSTTFVLLPVKAKCAGRSVNSARGSFRGDRCACASFTARISKVACYLTSDVTPVCRFLNAFKNCLHMHVLNENVYM